MTQAAAQTVDNYKRQALLQSLTAEYLDMFASMDDASRAAWFFTSPRMKAPSSASTWAGVKA